MNDFKTENLSMYLSEFFRYIQEHAYNLLLLASILVNTSPTNAYKA